MALHIHYGQNDSNVIYGTKICVPFPTTVIGPGAIRTLSYHDLVVGLLRSKQCFAPIGPISLHRLFSYRGNSTDLDTVLSNDVKSFTYAESGRYDLITYSSILRNLRYFECALAGNPVFYPDYSHEKFAIHESYRGSLSGVQTPLVSSRKTFYWLNVGIETDYTGGSFCHHGTLSSVLPFNLTPRFDRYQDYWSYSIFPILDRLSKDGMYYNDLVNRQEKYITNLSYSVSPSGLLIRYHFRLFTRKGPNSPEDDDCHADVKLTVPYLVPDATRTPVVGSSVDAALPFPTTYEFWNVSRTYFVQENGIDGKYSSNNNEPLLLLSTVPARTGLVDDDGDYNARKSAVADSGTLKVFAFRVRSAWNDITPSSVNSTADAVLGLENSFNTNLLQNLQKLPEFTSMLPQIKEATHVLSRVFKRKLDLMTLKELFDLLTSTELQKDFQWRPLIKLLTEYLPKLSSALASFSYEGQLIGRGSYSFNFPNGSFGRDGCHLTTRTKVVLEAGASTLLSAILGTDSLGILPKPSNIWDLVPFSFVLNWFTGVGNAMRRAEYMFLLHTLPAYFVHSYTITTPFTASELAAWNLQDVGVDRAGLRLYYRDVSLCTPVPRNSAYNFGIPTSLPPLATLGSLLYQLFIS